jgi:hypothetical protein
MSSYCVFQINTVYIKDTSDTSYKRYVSNVSNSINNYPPDQYLLETWIYVEADNEYIARSLIYFYYSNCKEIQYIGKFSELSDIKPPIHIFIDGYNKEMYEQFKNEYSYNF